MARRATALLLLVVVTVAMLAVTVDARPEDKKMMMMKKGSAMGGHKMMTKQPHQGKTQQHMPQHMLPQMMGTLTGFINPQAYAYPRPYMAYSAYSPAAYPMYSYSGGYPMYAYGMGGGYRPQQFGYSPYYGRW